MSTKEQNRGNVLSALESKQPISRRSLLKRASALGLAAPTLAGLLAACGDDEGTADDTSEDSGDEAGDDEESTDDDSADDSADDEATDDGDDSSGAEAPADGDQELIIANLHDIQSLDPLEASDYYSVTVFSLIHDTVGILDEDLALQPHLAESWDISDDGLVYTYEFRQGVMSHEGTELTADDVIFTLDRIFGEDAEGNPILSQVEMLDSYEKIDDYTVELTLQYAFAPFQESFGIQFIVPQDSVESIGAEEFGLNPVGYGPFKFVDYVPNDRVEMERFEDYWLTTPQLSSVVVRPIPEISTQVANLLAGDVHVIDTVTGPALQQLEDADDVNVDSKPGMNYTFAAFRMIDEPFTDRRFRQAVYMATDFDGLVGSIFPEGLAERAYNTVPPGLWPRDDEFMEELREIAPGQDQDQAQALFNELIEEGVMPENYSFTIGVPTDERRRQVGEAMVTDLQSLGLDVELAEMEFATYREEILTADQNAIYMLGTTPNYPDPDDNVRWLFGEAGSHPIYLNLSHRDEYEDWLAQMEQAMQSQDEDERAEIYRELLRTMLGEYFHIPLYHTTDVMGMRSSVQELQVRRIIKWDIVTPWNNVYIEE